MQTKSEMINRIAELAKENAELKAYKDVNEDFKTAWEELKAENERLKEGNVKLLFDKGALVEFCNKLTQIIDEKKESENKLLQTLQEIKEISENFCNACKEFDPDKSKVDNCQWCNYNRVLQLITKAEEE